MIHPPASTAIHHPSVPSSSPPVMQSNDRTFLNNLLRTTTHSPEDVNYNAINIDNASFFIHILFEITVISAHILKNVSMEMHKEFDLMTSIKNACA
jgi:hypothetical protein